MSDTQPPRPPADASNSAGASDSVPAPEAADPGGTEQPEPVLPPDLRFLRRLVTLLTAVMIAGIVAIVAILAFRLALPRSGPESAADGALPPLPAAIRLPEGATPAAVTFSESYTVVVTQAGEILLYTPDGMLAQRLAPD